MMKYMDIYNELAVQFGLDGLNESADGEVTIQFEDQTLLLITPIEDSLQLSVGRRMHSINSRQLPLKSLLMTVPNSVQGYCIRPCIAANETFCFTCVISSEQFQTHELLHLFETLRNKLNLLEEAI